MRRTALLLSLLLVLVAGTLPAAAGLVRGFRTDEVVLASGKVERGDAVPSGDLIRVVTGKDETRTVVEDGVEKVVTEPVVVEFPRAEVREVRPHAAFTGAHARRALSNPLNWQVLFWTTAIALLGTLGAVLLGVPYAVFMSRTDLPGRRVFETLYAAPLVLPPLLSAMAWDNLLPYSWLEGPEALGRWSTAFQAAALFALAYFPFVTLFTRRSLAAVGSATEEAAVLAAGPRRAFFRVTLPLARPGILLGALFAFVFCLNDFSVVDYLNIVRPVPRQVNLVYPYLLQITFAQRLGGVERLLVTGIPLFAVSIAAMGFALHRAGKAATATVGSTWRPPRPIPLGTAGRFGGWSLCGGVLAAGVLVPALELAFESKGLDAYRRVFRDGGASESLRLTLGLAIAAVLLATPVALVLAEAGRRLGRGAEVLLGGLAMLPLAIVPALVPMGAMEVWNRPAFTFTRGGGPWNPVSDTPVLAALIVFSRVLPFALAATWASLHELEPSLHEAAEAAGIPWTARMRRIVLPLARPGVALGALLAFVFAVREMDALAVLGTQTLLRNLWAKLHFMRDETVAAMAIVLLALLAFAFGLAAVLGMLRPRGGEAGPKAAYRPPASRSSAPS
jgi:iron(III) transport system permease protein